MGEQMLLLIFKHQMTDKGQKENNLKYAVNY
jgi:hypothetical protein